MRREDNTDPLMICTILGLKFIYRILPPTDFSIQLLNYLCELGKKSDFCRVNAELDKDQDTLVT
jgi:hypothetical protein